METERQPIVVRTFTGATQALAAEQFATDAVKADELGYTPTSQAWEGTTLTVVYQQRVPREAPPPPTAQEQRPGWLAPETLAISVHNPMADYQRIRDVILLLVLVVGIIAIVFLEFRIVDPVPGVAVRSTDDSFLMVWPQW